MVHHIAVLISPDFQLFDAAGPVAVFRVASRYRDDHYALRTVAAQAGFVCSSSGARWDADTPSPASQADTLLIVGGDGVDATMTDVCTRRFMQHCATRGARVASVCSGSLLLAAMDSLSGRHATTHWSRSKQFAHAFPQMQLEPSHIYINDGPIRISAGISADIDLTLALTIDDLGERLACTVARQLVMYCHRPGRQSQFSALNKMDPARDRFKPPLNHMWHSLGAPHRVGDLAEHAYMNPRHFTRAFQVEIGLTPAEAAEKLRVEAARAALESGAVFMQRVATECGFNDTERMRRSSQRLLGVPPSLLRIR